MPTIIERENARRRRLEIIKYYRTHDYTGQQDLINYLESKGMRVEQPQISKDLAALHMLPFTDRDGRQRMGVKSDLAKYKLPERYVKIFQEAVLGVDVCGNWVVVDTIPECSQIVAYIIAVNNFTETLSIMCGPTHVTILTKSEEDALEVKSRLEEGIV